MKSVYIKSANYIKQLKDKIRGGALTALTLNLTDVPYLRNLTIYNHYTKTILYNILKWYSLTILEPYHIYFYKLYNKTIAFS